jgi:hypothetical protein
MDLVHKIIKVTADRFKSYHNIAKDYGVVHAHNKDDSGQGVISILLDNKNTPILPGSDARKAFATLILRSNYNTEGTFGANGNTVRILNSTDIITYIWVHKRELGNDTNTTITQAYVESLYYAYRTTQVLNTDKIVSIENINGRFAPINNVYSGYITGLVVPPQDMLLMAVEFTVKTIYSANCVSTDCPSITYYC